MDVQPVTSGARVARGAVKQVKMLLPIDATGRSRWGIEYARRRWHAGDAVQVVLLFVAEPVTNWQVMRFWSQEQVRRFQAQRAAYLLEDAARPLLQEGIPVQTKFQEGETAFEILDMAEQLDCDEIVLPQPLSRWSKLFGADFVPDILRQQRGIPVITVDAGGEPQRLAHH